MTIKRCGLYKLWYAHSTEPHSAITTVNEMCVHLFMWKDVNYVVLSEQH